MLDRAGVVHKVQDGDKPGVLTIEAKDGERNDGYAGFIAQFAFFHNDGSLHRVESGSDRLPGPAYGGAARRGRRHEA